MKLKQEKIRPLKSFDTFWELCLKDENYDENDGCTITIFYRYLREYLSDYLYGKFFATEYDGLNSYQNYSREKYSELEHFYYDWKREWKFDDFKSDKERCKAFYNEYVSKFGIEHRTRKLKKQQTDKIRRDNMKILETVNAIVNASPARMVEIEKAIKELESEGRAVSAQNVGEKIGLTKQRIHAYLTHQGKRDLLNRETSILSQNLDAINQAFDGSDDLSNLEQRDKVSAAFGKKVVNFLVKNCPAVKKMQSYNQHAPYAYYAPKGFNEFIQSLLK